MSAHLPLLLQIAGVTQLLLVLGSLAIPRVMNWPRELKPLAPVMRQMFWVYAAYIWTFNLAFGLVSLFATDALLDRSWLAAAFTGIIALYWAGRVSVQWLVLDRGALAHTPIERAGLFFLEVGFIAWTVVYVLCATFNLGAP